MNSDATNTYSWDAENRMIKITYPGVNNYSTFGYDGYDQNVSIIETVAGSVASTKLFVWCGDDGRCEERNAAGSVTKLLMGDLGQTIAGSKYLFFGAQNDSVSEMTDSSGSIQAQYRYDPFGRVSKIQGSLDSDFQYAGYYYHARSGLNLTFYRAYNSNLGRWINRDPIEESGGINLFAYVDNDPAGNTDSSGLSLLILIWPWRPIHPSCGWNPPARPPGRPPKKPPGGGGGGGGGGGDDDPPPPKKTPDNDDDIGPSGGGGGGRGPRNDDPQRGKIRPNKGRGQVPNNQQQNKAFRDAVKEIERRIGKKLSQEQIRQLHNEITGEGLTYQEIVDTGIALFEH